MPWLTDFSLSIKSRLAQRTLLLLVITASLPLLLSTWLISTYTDRYVDSKSRQALARQAKHYGLGLLQRLELASAALQTAPVTLPQHDHNRMLEPYFSVVKTAINADDLEIEFGASAAAHVAKHGSLVRVVADAGGAAAVALVSLREREGWRIGLLHPEYLWQTASLPHTEFMSISDGTGVTLFASAQEPHEDQHAERESRMASWDLFLQQRFDAGRWQVHLLQPQEAAGAEPAQYKQALLLILLPTLALLTLIASVLIRRSHGPLSAMIAATRQISTGDFSSYIPPSGDRDSRSLAIAFNEMSRRIEHQFDTLAVLQRLDQQILASSSLEDIVQTIMGQAHKVLPSCSTGLLLFARDQPEFAHHYLSASAGARQARVHVSEPLLARLHAMREPASIRHSDILFDSTRALVDRDLQIHAVLLLPIRTEQRLHGALLVAVADAPRAALRHSQGLALGLAERMAVAISNTDRQEALVRQAHYDALTQLPNRLLFKDRLAQQIVHCQRTHSAFALLFLDLDRFKNVNDSFGHSRGDELLKCVAARLSTELPGVDTVARLGGDEFTVIVAESDAMTHAADVAHSIIAALSAPVVLNGTEHFVSACIGIALFPHDGSTAEVLLRNADIAMYRAKTSGPGRIAYFEQAMNRETLERAELENALRHAIASNELFMVYQAQIALNDGSLIGAEALSRWHHPRLGPISPDRFIRIAEDCGLILALGERVLQQACEQYAAWRDAGLPLQHLAVNVSMRQLQHGSFCASMRQNIDRYRIPAGVLEMEITESTLAADMEQVSRVLRDLRNLGVRIAIDDFGTGYSALAYLRELPIDTLKIDRTFLPNDQSPDAPVLCEAIIAMARALQLAVVAEGVETTAQAEFLRQRGCDFAQGFLFARPLPAQEFLQRFGAQIDATQPVIPRAASG